MSLSANAYQVLIIGAGAAGCYAAIHAAMRGKTVLLIEQNHDIGQKIRISGGGRCNITNLSSAPEHYLSHNPGFCRSALARHTPQDFLAWFYAQGLHTEEKTKGQLFCREKSRGVIAALQRELDRTGVTLSTHTQLKRLIYQANGYVAQTNQGAFYAEQCVIATGGSAYPKLGGSSIALKLAKQFALNAYPFIPALVPLTLPTPLINLSGISCEVIAQTIDGVSFQEQLLFTHRGLSGPVMLQLSSYWKSNTPIYINFLPNHAHTYLIEYKQSHPNHHIKTALKSALPTALAHYLSDTLAPKPADTPLQHYSNADLLALMAQCQHYVFYPDGTEGLGKAEVTTGGIDTRAFNPKTFACKTQPNLYAIGEALDVTGQLGGFNFQWAWASAWCCAQAL